jgi:UDP:flavonoid glycosyltransferase YjiC (YdhE family)
MDQFVGSQTLVNAGAGLMLAASRATPRAIERAVRALVEDPRYAAAARALQPLYEPSLAPTRFHRWVMRKLALQLAA